jgi:hypothetical protein
MKKFKNVFKNCFIHNLSVVLRVALSGSRSITEVKQHWKPSVLWWVTVFGSLYLTLQTIAQGSEPPPCTFKSAGDPV